MNAEEMENKAKVMAEFIGRYAVYTFQIGKNNIEVDMIITDARHIFKRDEVKLVPVSGYGSGWANINNIKIEEAS